MQWAWQKKRTAYGILPVPDAGEADGKRIAAIMNLSIERNSTDVMTVRDGTRDATGTEYNTGHVQGLMRRHGLSHRRVQNVHVSHAAPTRRDGVQKDQRAAACHV